MGEQPKEPMTQLEAEFAFQQLKDGAAEIRKGLIAVLRHAADYLESDGLISTGITDAIEDLVEAFVDIEKENDADGTEA